MGSTSLFNQYVGRYHNLDLPPWRDGVAPSVETLPEPNEERFCAYYHELFVFDHDELKERFKKQE